MLPPIRVARARGAIVVTLLQLAAQAPASADRFALPPERANDPPGLPARAAPTAPAAAAVVYGRFHSIQVNVNAAGANVTGDAANEPSIAVDPADHAHLAIGWRQFDTVGSDFRQAGFAASTDGGQTWTAGKIQPGVFLSDPVLAVDADGDFFYSSVTSNLHAQVCASSNHGASWGAPLASFGGDKTWLVFDRASSAGRNDAYESWNTSGNSYFPNTFSRSLDDAMSFQSPSAIPGTPVLGTMDVAPDGTVYVVGTDQPGGPFVVAHSTDAWNGLVTPTFTTDTLDLGGTFRGGPPNPEGLLGQPWIVVDRSVGPHAGWVYVLASVQTPTDPLDVECVRSTDGGGTWSAPVRVNDDPPGDHAFQWFGTLSASPDGRLDAIWNDTRDGADSTVSAVYYATSTDGGATWSANERVTPTWSSMVGFPKQKKIGDYDQMISDATGADLAYAATFNHEQDIYYVRLTLPMAAANDAGPTRGHLTSTPNPFISATTIQYDVPRGGGRVTVDVVDLAGRRVARLADGSRPPGPQSVTWNGLDFAGRPVPAGVYLCRCIGSGSSATQRLVRMR